MTSKRPKSQKMRILKPRLPIPQILPLKVRQPPTSRAQHCVTCRNVPLHGTTQTWIEIGFASSHQADLQGGAGVTDFGDFLVA